MISNQDSVAETSVTQESSGISSMTDVDQTDTQAFKSFSKPNTGKPSLKRSDMHPASPSRLLADTSQVRTQELSPAFKAYCNIGATDSLMSMVLMKLTDQHLFVNIMSLNLKLIHQIFLLLTEEQTALLVAPTAESWHPVSPLDTLPLLVLATISSPMWKSVLLVLLSGQTEDL